MVNVRLQHIADEAIVSIGNIAYHYPNKQAILLAIYEELIKQKRIIWIPFGLCSFPISRIEEEWNTTK